MSKVFAIIVAGGQSQRFGKDKLFSNLAGQPVIWHTLNAFQENKQVSEIILVCSEKNLTKMQKIGPEFSKIKKIILGGETRQQSSQLGLKSIVGKKDDIVLFHNGANPLVNQADIQNVIKATQIFDCAVLGKPKKSTLKKIDLEKFIVKTIDRTNLWATQTPQGIKYSLAIKGFKKAESEHFEGTDDVQLIERLGEKVKIVECSFHNLKITESHDLYLANLILQDQSKFLVGIGQDSHRFSKTQKALILGNYKISDSNGLEANSDGDVILHALCNAFSSAIGEYSLSTWADTMCTQGITNSKIYLEKIYQKVQKTGYLINNLSISLEAGKPQLEKNLPAIQKHLAKTLKIKPSQIGITVTSGEKLTEFGQGKGIQCFCYLSLIKI